MNKKKAKKKIHGLKKRKQKNKILDDVNAQEIIARLEHRQTTRSISTAYDPSDAHPTF